MKIPPPDPNDHRLLTPFGVVLVIAAYLLLSKKR
jgi:hypothetical protein